MRFAAIEPGTARGRSRTRVAEIQRTAHRRQHSAGVGARDLRRFAGDRDTSDVSGRECRGVRTSVQTSAETDNRPGSREETNLTLRNVTKLPDVLCYVT